MDRTVPRYSEVLRVREGLEEAEGNQLSVAALLMSVVGVARWQDGYLYILVDQDFKVRDLLPLSRDERQDEKMFHLFIHDSSASPAFPFGAIIRADVVFGVRLVDNVATGWSYMDYVVAI